VLLMVMLWKLRPELVRAGRLYCARPPLYRIVPKKGEARYVYSDEERDAAIKTLGGMGRVEKVQRFKGLGEMSAAEIAETLFSPEARANQVRVSVEDVEEVTRTFQLLMGSEVEPRKNWLMQTWSQPA
jgi:DNA gyrase subunit B